MPTNNILFPANNMNLPVDFDEINISKTIKTSKKLNTTKNYLGNISFTVMRLNYLIYSLNSENCNAFVILCCALLHSFSVN